MGPMLQVPVLFVLTCVSLFVSTTTFIFSMLHLGSDSLYVIPILFLFTLAYHTSILVADYRKAAKEIVIVHPRLDLKHRPPSSISSTLPSVVCGALLAALWLGAFGLTIVSAVFVLRKLTSVKGQDRGTFVWLIFVQMVLSLLEAIVLVLIVVRSALERKFGGPEIWKRACEEAV